VPQIAEAEQLLNSYPDPSVCTIPITNPIISES